MPRRVYDEDLFRDSTMTFGEHLEELRGSLFRAIIGLVIGFLIGLFLGNRVVRFIQTPLTNALTQYYEDKDLTEADAVLQKLKKEGKALPGDPAQLKYLVKEGHIVPEQVFIQPDEIVRALKEHYPESFADLKLPLAPDSSDPNGKSATDDEPSEDAKAAATKDQMVQAFIWHPIGNDQRVRVKTLNAHEAFVIYVKASLLVGALLASPWIFYQLWSFVAAGLYPHEKRYVHFFLPVSLGLFLAGASLAFFAVMEPVLTFLFRFNQWMGIDPDPRISEWLGFVLMLPLGFGVAFQLPLVMLFLERIGIFSVKAYVANWKLTVLVMFVLGALFTPPDPYSQILMAMPLCFLYLLGILLCKYLPRGDSPFAEEG